MTVAVVTRKNTYTTTGATTGPFAVTFPFFEIEVYLDGSLVDPANYSISGGSGSTGNVTFTSAPTGALVIIGATNQAQQIDYISSGEVEPESAERGLDRLHMISQEQQRVLDLLAPTPETLVQQTNFPDLSGNANKVPRVNSGGTAWEMVTVGAAEDAVDAIAARDAAQAAKTGAEAAQTAAEAAQAAAEAAPGLETGIIMMYLRKTAPDGWVRCNGRTIGNASSGATERANADCEALYEMIWHNYQDSVCPVTGGRGASGQADFDAGKPIALPDLRGRAFFGLDDMGNSAASRLGNVITNETTNGASGGSEEVTLTEAQLPSHTHGAGTLATASDGAHTHQLNVSHDANGSNNNAAALGGSDGFSFDFTTTSDGAHTHTISGSTGSTGSGNAHSNMPPAWLTTFIIKL